MDPASPLDDQQRAVLAFERSWWQRRRGPTKAAAVRTELGISPTRYYRVLSGLLDAPAALAHDPLLVRRLRRRRDERRRARFTGEPTRRRAPR